MMLNLTEEFKNAMREKDVAKKAVVSELKERVKNFQIKNRKNGNGNDADLNDQEFLTILKATMKSLEGQRIMYADADRIDEVTAYDARIGYLNTLMPKALTEDEIGDIIAKSICAVSSDLGVEKLTSKNMGLVMKKAKEAIVETGCDANMGEVSKLIKDCLV